ncbi:EpsG family protein, partial [Morganella morganii]|uniref:EpsG family protein n=1 Tax=Morganella morganii TaxID=582 RepID=UPI0013DE0145
MISEYSPLFIIIISLLFLAISIVFEINKNKQLSSLIALIIILSYSIIFGLRDYSIGSDTSSYVDNFLYSNWNFEYLFSLITTIIQTLTNEPQIYLVIMTVIYGITIYLYTCLLYT